MAKELSLSLDLFDKDSVRAAAVELAKIIDGKRRELAELEERYERLRVWGGLPERESGRARARRAAASAENAERGPSIEDEAVRILDEAGRGMTTMEVLVEMKSDANPKTVNWALWNAERSGRIQRLPYEIAGKKGVYASLAYVPENSRDGQAEGTAGKDERRVRDAELTQ